MVQRVVDGHVRERVARRVVLICVLSELALFLLDYHDTLQHFSRSTEETLEMLAISLLWFLFLRNLPRISSGGLQVRFEPKQD